MFDLPVEGVALATAVADHDRLGVAAGLEQGDEGARGEVAQVHAGLLLHARRGRRGLQDAAEGGAHLVVEALGEGVAHHQRGGGAEQHRDRQGQHHGGEHQPGGQRPQPVGDPPRPGVEPGPHETGFST
jgi:hypothetical protein